MIFSVHRVFLRLLFRIRHYRSRLLMPQVVIALLLIGSSLWAMSGDVSPQLALAAQHAPQPAGSSTSNVSVSVFSNTTAQITPSVGTTPTIATGQPLVPPTPTTPTGTPTSTSTPLPTSTPTTALTPYGTLTLPSGGQISPYLFGTNMGLFDGNDQVLTSSTTRALLTQMRIPIIRMPVRSGLSDAVEIQAAQAIKQIGAVPLVILHGAVDANALADNTRVINYINSIFGNSPVFYEVGNEEDLAGVNASRYLASWNSIVPQLKQLAPNAYFIGPVNFQYDANYLRTFLQQANPRPDAVSWHEYTCDDSWTQALCVSHIDNWTKHINDARTMMTATIGTALPIMITEYNYAPNATPNDGKNNDATFMTTWTVKALQTLAADNIYAAMQYSVTNTAIPMVDTSGAPTTQGAVFQSLYQALLTQGHLITPTALPTVAVTPTTPTPTVAVTPTDTPTAVVTPTPTATPSPTPSPTATPTSRATATPTPKATSTPKAAVTPTPTSTTPTVTPTLTPTPSGSNTE